MDEKVIIKKVVEEIITTIENEIEESTSSTIYKCNGGSFINTDVGFVNEWFEEYKYILQDKYCN